VDKKILKKIVLEIDKENSLFANKACFDIFAPPCSIVGREDKAKSWLDS